MNVTRIMHVALLSLLTHTMFAQGGPSEEDSWRLGISGGVHASGMHITQLNPDLYPDRDYNYSGVFSLYVQKSFGEQHHWALRPEVAILNRGGAYTGIMRNVMGYYTANGVEDIAYRVKAHYVDFRLPVMYRFGSNTSRVRPYIYLAPVVGLTTGGTIAREVTLTPGGSSTITNESLDATRANLSPVDIAGAAGIGADVLFNIGGHTCTLGLEVMYEHGLTNTYGKDKDATDKISIVPGLVNADYAVITKRRFSGLEAKLTFSVPFSVFRSKPKPAQIIYIKDVQEPVQEKPVVVEPEPEPVVEQPCYTLDEIDDMINRGQSVYGKTICAIEGMITFDFGKSTIKPESYEFLNKMAKMLRRTNSRVMIKGHTDSVGEDDFNMNLSKQRAIAVKDYLENHGVPHDKLYYSYFGETEPIADNETPEGRRLNRRVEFELLD